MSEPAALPPVIPPPAEPALELRRMRRSVRAKVFGGETEPTRIGRFRLIECIGRGGMGVVWSARDEELDRIVAIKLLRPDLSSGDLTAEARALARLSHPNVVAVYDVGQHDAQRFIAMEFVRGQTLRAWCREPRGVQETIAKFVEAGRGLAAAHAVGLVHRDFKPDNVLVSEDDGRPRVLDFGLARAPDLAGGPIPVLPAGTDPFSTTMTHAGLLVGTPAYMAPEQHLGEAADARSDQFAFAVALLEGLCGRLPFEGHDMRALSLQIVRGRWSPPPAGVVPPAVLAVLARALSVDPNARFEGVPSLLDALTSADLEVDPRLNTRAVEGVLARAAELSGGSSRPGLSAAEVREVAAEAGIDPAHAQRAIDEALVPQAVTPSVSATALARIDVDIELTDDVSVRARLPRINTSIAAVLVTEMERRERGKGTATALGASTTWQSSDLELHLDPTAHDTQLVLTQKLGLLARTRALRYAAVGMVMAVAAIMPMMVVLFDDAEGIIVAMVFSSMGLGAWLGTRVAQRRNEVHRRKIAASLRTTAERLHALAEANTA